MHTQPAPHPGTVRGKVLALMQEHPDRTWTFKQVAQSLHVSRNSASGALYSLNHKYGLVRQVNPKAGRGRYQAAVYTIGSDAAVPAAETEDTTVPEAVVIVTTDADGKIVSRTDSSGGLDDEVWRPTITPRGMHSPGARTYARNLIVDGRVKKVTLGPGTLFEARQLNPVGEDGLYLELVSDEGARAIALAMIENTLPKPRRKRTS